MKYEENTWYGWNGGECPVHPETVVEVMWGEREIREAECFIWSHNGHADIVAFRVIKEYKEPREWWIWPNGNDVLGKKPHVGGEHYIRVREVLPD